MEIGVLSDTRGYLDPLVTRLLRGVETILHAGDVGGSSILDVLATMAPLTAVRGNMDPPDLVQRLPERAEVRCGGSKILLIHDAGVGPRLLHTMALH